MLSTRTGGTLVALSLVCAAATASAHHRLTFPTPRYPNPPAEDSRQLKAGPCGVDNDTRTTDTSRISTFEPGQRITVTWKETIDHPGHYRIAFDDDGQDDLVDPSGYDDIQQSPTLPVLADGIADRSGGNYSFEVTLPDVECDRCTLQLIQVMTDKAPWDGNELYYQCADIVLARSGSGNAGAPSSGGQPGSSGNAGAAGVGAGGGGGGNSGSPGTPAGGSTAATGGGTAHGGGHAEGGGDDLNGPSSDDEGGCALASPGPASSSLLLWLGVGALALFRRRAAGADRGSSPQ
jgi:hypothetical protein